MAESAKKAAKSAREYTGQESPKEGRRSKRELEQANAYEKKRRDEELARIERRDEERRARRRGGR